MLAQAINSEAARRGGAIAPPPPTPVPTPTDVAAEMSPGLMWGLVGFNLVLAGVGAYLHASREG